MDNKIKPELPDNLVWYYHESLWQAMVNMRLNGGLLKFQVDLDYLDDFGINVDLNAKVNKLKLNTGGNFNEYESTVWHFEGEF